MKKFCLNLNILLFQELLARIKLNLDIDSSEENDDNEENSQ